MQFYLLIRKRKALYKFRIKNMLLAKSNNFCTVYMKQNVLISAENEVP